MPHFTVTERIRQLQWRHLAGKPPVAVIPCLHSLGPDSVLQHDNALLHSSYRRLSMEASVVRVSGEEFQQFPPLQWANITQASFPWKQHGVKVRPGFKPPSHFTNSPSPTAISADVRASLPPPSLHPPSIPAHIYSRLAACYLLVPQTL